MKNKTLLPFPAVVDAMHEKAFCITQLIRKVRPYFKTVRFNNPNVFSLVSKETGNAVKIHVSQENGRAFIDVRWSSKYGEDKTFGLFVDSNKQMLQKLLKHNLI